MLYLLGFDLLTGVFVLVPAGAASTSGPACTLGGVLRNWGLVFFGNFAGALTVALMMAVVFTFGFSTAARQGRQRIGNIGEARTARLCDTWRGRHADAVHPRHALQLDGLDRRRRRHDLDHRPGKVIAMWMPIMVFFYMAFEHSVVNMFLFPSGLMLQRQFLDHGLFDLERDPDRARQSGRRHCVHRPHAVFDPRQDGTEAGLIRPDSGPVRTPGSHGRAKSRPSTSLS